MGLRVWLRMGGAGASVKASKLARVSIGFLFRAGARKGISAMSHIYSDAWGASPRQSKGNAQETAGTMGCFRWKGHRIATTSFLWSCFGCACAPEKASPMHIQMHACVHAQTRGLRPNLCPYQLLPPLVPVRRCGEVSTQDDLRHQRGAGARQRREWGALDSLIKEEGPSV